MKKTHGPAFRKQRIELVQCPACRGRAVTPGVFHDLACVQCNASGWVAAGTLQALPLDDLVTQLSLKLQAAHTMINALRRGVGQGMGPAAHYEQNNRRGAGGTNYTGD